MTFSFKQLAVFEAIAKTGNVSQAADELALTQSATSMALMQLEKSLGKPLFERKSKRMALTTWGHWLRPKCKTILHDINQIEASFAEQQILNGDIRVAVSQTAAEHIFPSVIKNIDADYPQLRIALSVKNSEQVIEGIRNYQYDLGVIEGNCDDSQIAQQIWCRDHLMIVASKNHPYARFKRVSLSQLEQAEWVLREQGSGIRAIFEEAIEGHLDQLNVRREFEQIRVIKSLVASGTYLSCLPYFDVKHAIENGNLIELKVPALNMRRSMTFIWRADAIDNPLRDCIKSESLRWIKSMQIEPVNS
ncbi:LysR substrate-binding domain-containing protein [Ferrimonas lipolytica]|uniref:LysR family transcriptional regulator n=1 Tax=Ferrimonas lipolytica TaxID=2724191 RepID=A0A6H1UGQ7_9GAMM|nr:LysR substrate-binding domain-containing protein [Ferrimonas lipolytica]QIZ78271.1 LysR family transcriptional regulator [Ferrimonas lipolytica]